MTFLYFASPSYQSRAAVLRASIVKHHPNALIVEVPCDVPNASEFYPQDASRNKLIKAKELLLEGHRQVVMIGADCELFSPLEEVEQFYGNVLLVPHAVRPLKDRKYMCQLYRTGHANGDFVVFNATWETLEILDWLISVVESRDNREDNSFYEQTWLSSLPFLFDKVKVLRHPGYNVGYWDIKERDIRESEGEYYAIGRPVRFMHYSGFDESRPQYLSKHALDLKTDCPIILGLYESYYNRIK